MESLAATGFPMYYDRGHSKQMGSYETEKVQLQLTNMFVSQSVLLFLLEQHCGARAWF